MGTGVIRRARRTASTRMTAPTVRRPVVAGLIALAGVALTAPAAAAPTRTVVLEDIDFTPSRLVVKKGTTVTWRWDDGRTRHDVRSVGARRFKGSALKATGTHRVTFRRAGTYRYVCTAHLGMDGRVVVR